MSMSQIVQLFPGSSEWQWAAEGRAVPTGICGPSRHRMEPGVGGEGLAHHSGMHLLSRTELYKNPDSLLICASAPHTRLQWASPISQARL